MKKLIDDMQKNNSSPLKTAPLDVHTSLVSSNTEKSKRVKAESAHNPVTNGPSSALKKRDLPKTAVTSITRGALTVASDAGKQGKPTLLLALANRLARPVVVQKPPRPPRLLKLKDGSVSVKRVEMEGLREALQGAEVLNSRLYDEVTSVKAKLQALENSTSWRITAPVRGSINALRSIVSGRAFESLNPKQAFDRLIGELRFAHPGLPPVAPVAEKSLSELDQPNPLFVGIGDGDIVSIRLGLQMPLKAIGEAMNGRSLIFYENKLPNFDQIRHAQVVFLKRTYMTETVQLVKRLAAAGVPLVYMIDDDFSAIPAKSPLGQRFRELNAFKNIEEQVKLAAHTVVWSPAMAKKLKPFAKSISKFRGPSNVEIFDSFPVQVPIEGDKVRIGYAGGATHRSDLEMLQGPILRLLNERPNVIFESIGLKIDWLVGHPQYEYFEPKSKLEEFYQLLASRQWTIGVAPLVLSAFNMGKSDNKLREYAGAGLAGVYSNIPVYSESVVDGVDGVLSQNTDDAWYNAIIDLLDNPEKTRSIAAKAKEMARAMLSEEKTLQQYYDVLRIAKKKLRVLVIGPQHLPTLRIDIHAPFNLLSDLNEITWIGLEHENATTHDVDSADVLVVVRAVETTASRLVEHARKTQKAVIYTWDDNWLQFPKDETPLSNFIWLPENQRSLKSMLRQSHVVKSSTPDIYRESLRYNRSVIMYPYGFDFSLAEGVKLRRKSKKGTRIGYFGTIGRDKQFEFVLDALKIVQEKHPNTELEFFGFIPERAHELQNVSSIAYTEDYQSSMRQFLSLNWDIGLAPLGNFAFNEAKLPTKYRDYAAAKCAGVYSTNKCYKNVVVDRQTGLLRANNAEDWAAAIIELIENDKLRETIATNAYDHLINELSADVAAGWWRDVITLALSKTAILKN